MRCISLLLAVLPLACAQVPFPIAFKSINAAQSSALSSLYHSYEVSLVLQPAYTTFAVYMAEATNLPIDAEVAFESAGNDPVSLADSFFTATATPAWYTEIPNDLQSYVSSVANAEASITAQVVGAAERLVPQTAVVGALLMTGLVMVLML